MGKPKPNKKVLIRRLKNNDKRQKTNSSSPRVGIILVTFGSFLLAICALSFLLIGIERGWIHMKQPIMSRILKQEQAGIHEFLREGNAELDTINLRLLKFDFEVYLQEAKSQLPRIQGRMASLKIQTAQYEQMSTKIAGGPKTFIASGLQELEQMEEDLERIQDVAFNSFNLREEAPDDARKSGIQRFSFLNLPKSKRRASTEEELEFLSQEGIDLWPNPEEESNQENPETTKATIATLDETINFLKEAAKILGKLSERYFRIDELTAQVQYNYYMEVSSYPDLVAKCLYKLGYGRVDLMTIFKDAAWPDVWAEMIELRHSELEFKRPLDNVFRPEYGDVKELVWTIWKSLVEKKKHAETFQLISPMKETFFDRAEDYFNEEVKKPRTEKEMSELRAFKAYLNLLYRMFGELMHLRNRVRKLGDLGPVEIVTRDESLLSLFDEIH